MAFLYQRGVYVRDKITGFAGCVVIRSDYITGCNRYGIEGEAKDNKPGELTWIDEQRLEVDDAKQRLQLGGAVDQPPG